MKNRLTIIILVMLLFGLNSCEKEYDAPIDFKYEYFPLDSGSVWIYDAVKINVNDFTETIDTHYTQIKEVVGPSFIDLEGDSAVEIWRYEKDDTAIDWGVRKVWWAKRNETQAEKVRENLRFIKLVFPPRVGLEWNGNIHINIQNDIEFFEDWEYEYLEVDAKNTVNGIIYDSTLFVLQIDDENLLIKKYSSEIYAKNIGLVYKEEIFLESKTNEIGEDWTNPEKWLKGYILKMNLISYTK